ncbi:aminotransferase class IV [Pontibacter locisalis]|uniref:branched-chain-amino-acid transaminase n=1 Tax=Pontibacter locisalis TaxID=1719035 RepID=A0ABW5IQ36_9BACT
MYLLFNNELLPEEEFRLPLTNRAFQYNDGFFETVMVVNGKLRFWSDHLDRMQEAAQALNFNVPSLFLENNFEQVLLNLSHMNGAQASGRLKLKVWRAGAGLYSPQTSDIDWLATAQVASVATVEPLSIGVCEKIRTAFSPLSHFKGPNSPIYVLASMDKQRLKMDDVLLLSSEGYIAELTSSNIFWFKDNELFTPTLETGCVNGIMRRNILRWCESEGILVRESKAPFTTLFLADEVFSANVTGIKDIYFLNGKPLHRHSTLADYFRNQLNMMD